MTITLTVENTRALEDALRAYGEQARRAVGEAVRATGLEVRGDIQRAILRGPKTGRTYLRGSVSHRASAPGQPPASDTGTLASSIVYAVTGQLSAKVETRLPYGAMLEFGTQRIEPRPSWTPAVERAGPRLQDRVERALRGLAT